MPPALVRTLGKGRRRWVVCLSRSSLNFRLVGALGFLNGSRQLLRGPAARSLSWALSLLILSPGVAVVVAGEEAGDNSPER